MAKKKKPEDFEPLQLISDEPVGKIGEDALELNAYAKTIAGIALGTKGPFTIGAYGKWGTGKTSLMLLAKDMIDARKQEDVVTVWFNVWQYEKEAHPVVPLIGCVIRAVEKKVKEDEGFAKKAGKTFLNALRAVAYGFSAKAEGKIPILGSLGVGFGGKDTIDRYDELGKSPIDALLDRSLYFQAFETLRETDLGLKVVVFIDDLDRCFPKQALHLLEAVKLILCQEGFVFVIGVAHQMIEEYIRKIYVEEYGIKQYEEQKASYLDKIVQLPLPLPSHERHFEAFLKRLLEANVVPDELKKAVLSGDVLPHLGAACHNTPRSAVRLLNNLIVDVRLWALTRDDEMPVPMFVVSRAVQQVNSELYEILCHDRPHLGKRVREELQRLMRRRDVEAAAVGKRAARAEATQDEKVKPDELLSGAAFENLWKDADLCKFLGTGLGRRWLEDRETRENIYNFRSVEASAAPEPEAATGDAVIRAIREACRDAGTSADKLRELGLPAGADGDWSSLASLSSLRLVHLDGTQVTDAGLQHIRGLISLEWLGLDGTQVVGSGLLHIEAMSSLLGLSLVSTRVGDAELQHIKALKNLKRLYLDNTLVGDAGLQHIKSLGNLQRLGLRNTHVSDAGLQHIRGLNKLQRLYLNTTGVGDPGLQHIKSLHNLQRLDLTDTQVTDAGLEHLRALTSLEYLWLEGTQVTDAGLEHLRALTSLQRLWLEGTQVTDAGLEHLRALTSLQTLDLTGTQVTDAGVGRLKAARPDLGVSR